MNQKISLLEELYSLLISGNYLYDETISFLDFIRILRVIKSCKVFPKCLKESHVGLNSLLGILEFLQNVNAVKLDEKKRIEILNDDVFASFYRSSSRKKLLAKLMRKIPYTFKLIRKRSFLKKNNLLKLYLPNFELNIKSFQLPCSIKTSFKRAITIVRNIYLASQKILFIGDDDLVSVLCKFIMPELHITVIEIDGRITNLLKEIAEENKFEEFYVYNTDFKELELSPELLTQKFSIIHLDPPYEAKEIEMFFKNILLILDNKIVQIFLNGQYDLNSMHIINQFIIQNHLNISKYYKYFNSYPLKTLDSKYLKYLKKQIKLEFNFRFNEKSIREMELSSDLLLIEKGWIDNSK